MALNERLALLVSLDAQGAVRGLNDVGKAADRNLGRTENKLDRTATQFQRAGVGMLATAGLLGAGLFKAGQSAAELEQAVGGTEAVFKDTSGVIDKFAKDAAQSFGLSETAARTATTSMGGQLKGLGFSVDEAAAKAIELTETAADLAATYGGTTAEAVQALGAAFRGEADPAERFNLFLNQNRVNAEAVALGLAESTSKVDANAKAQATLSLITKQSADAQGQFAREIDTASGAMQIANAEFENAKAALGESVAPIMADVASKLGGLADGFSKANDASGGLVSQLAAYGTIGLGAAGGLSFVIGKTIQLRDSIKGLPSTVSGLASGLGNIRGPAGAAAVGVGLFAAVMLKAKSQADGLRDAARELADEAEATGQTLEETVTAKLAETFAESDQVAQAMRGLSVSFEDLRDPLQGSSEDFDDWKQSLIDSTQVSTGARSNAELLADRVGRLREELAKAEEITNRASTATEELGLAEAGAVGPTDELAGATEGLAEGLKEADEAYGNLVDAVLGFADSDLALRQSIDKTDDALLELAEAQKEAADKGGKNREANEALEDALFGAEGAMLAQAGAAVTAAEKAAELSGKTLSAADKQAILRTSLGQLRDSLAPGSPLRIYLDRTIAQLDAIATDRQATVNITIATRRAELGRVLDGAMAEGGPVSAGKTYLVGERGPEIVTMGANGFVTPNHALGGGPGGGQVYNITVNAGPGSPGPEFVRAVKDAISVAQKRGVA